MKRLFILVFALVFLLSGLAFSGSKVYVSTWGFNLDLIDKNITKPFKAKYGIDIVRELGNNSTRLTKLEVQKKNPVIDVVHFADYYAALAKTKGLIQPIDVSKLKNYEKIYNFAKNPIGDNYAIAYSVFGYGIVYRTDKIKTPITSWKDFWREDLKGRIALPNITITYGPAFMMLTNELWGGKANDPSLVIAFDKLAALKPDVVTFYKRSSELINLFKMGEIWAAPVARFAWGRLLATGLPLKWVNPEEGMLGFMSTVSIVKGAKHLDEAYKYIDFILSKEVQEAEAMDLVDSPVNKEVKVPKEIAEKLTYGEEQMKSLRFYDLNFIVENRDKWLKIWNEKIAGK